MTTRISDLATVSGRIAGALALILAVSSCSNVGGIDTTLTSPISNDDTFATLGYFWAGARSAIQKEREPSTNTFNLALNYALPCTRGGQGSYQGTLAGTKSGGTGTAKLALGAVITACQFDERVRIITISAPALTVSGTVAVTNDAWGAVNIRMVASAVTVNGVSCPGGVDVTLTGTSPSGQLTSTGTSCGRTGAVALP